MLLNLTPAARVQGGLFDQPDSAKSAARMKAVDQLNRRFGRDDLFRCLWLQARLEAKKRFHKPALYNQLGELLAL